MGIDGIGQNAGRDRIAQKAVEAYGPKAQKIGDKTLASAPRAVEKTQQDEVSISADARKLQEAQKAIQDSPDVRADKVAAIKKQVEEGTYTVSPQALADKMMSVFFDD